MPELLNVVVCTGPECPLCAFIGSFTVHKVCGARSPETKGEDDDTPLAVCNRAPHSVELLPEGDPNHTRWHQEWRDGLLWAEWSSLLPDDDEGRLWPDGSIGPRKP